VLEILRASLVVDLGNDTVLDTRVEGMPEACVAELCPGDQIAAKQLTDAIEATEHGYAHCSPINQ
jgi:hypothetical protein